LILELERRVVKPVRWIASVFLLFFGRREGVELLSLILELERRVVKPVQWIASVFLLFFGRRGGMELQWGILFGFRL
jgi:hypothetical protein